MIATSCPQWTYGASPGVGLERPGNRYELPVVHGLCSNLCMSTKTISVRLEAYERLARARKTPSESFSDVIMRARWDAQPSTAGEYLRVVRERGPAYRVDELAEIEDRKRDDRPPTDKWIQD